ncbi:nuclease-related domain-containing protein [Rossellomorea sp. BNER]|uniref:nuclease-related domain-containing protein n=1 Tax=Rossellomorea sp. BNER TaxID=2962031 RepID=UPI003AF2E532|nr:NERD domain-containing protein [Rossellomorea sp. BNER]
MILKPRKKPKHIHKLEALLRRLPRDHPKREILSESLNKRMAGYKGEQSLDYPLSFLSNQKFRIFHDVRLFDGTHYFQIDTLIISQHFILIVEVKNIKGILYFDSDFNQLIRIREEKKEPFPDPVLQVEKQSDQFEKWLQKTNFPKIPIESLVVIGSSQAILQTSPNNEYIYKKVLLNNKFPFKMKEFQKVYQKEYLSIKQIDHLSNQILKDHSPLEVDILLQHSISKNEILKGAQCSSCSFIPLEREKGKWRCSKCNSVSKKAHIKALHDYGLLIDDIITNQEMRDFLYISSSAVAKKILTSMKLNYTGNNKGRVYSLKFEEYE